MYILNFLYRHYAIKSIILIRLELPYNVFKTCMFRKAKTVQNSQVFVQRKVSHISDHIFKSDPFETTEFIKNSDKK